MLAATIYVAIVGGVTAAIAAYFFWHIFGHQTQNLGELLRSVGSASNVAIARLSVVLVIVVLIGLGAHEAAGGHIGEVVGIAVFTLFFLVMSILGLFAAEACEPVIALIRALAQRAVESIGAKTKTDSQPKTDPRSAQGALGTSLEHPPSQSRDPQRVDHADSSNYLEQSPAQAGTEAIQDEPSVDFGMASATSDHRAPPK